MSADPACGGFAAGGDAGVQAERMAGHLRMLAELAEIGMELARDLRRPALGPAPGAGGADADPGAMCGVDAALAYTRVARAVRQTVALSVKLTAEANERGRQDVRDQAVRSAAERKRTKQKKERIRKLAEDAIAADADCGDAETLRLNLDERLDDPETEEDLGCHPIGAVYANICADLGINADLRYFSDAELGLDIPRRPSGQEVLAVPQGPVAVVGDGVVVSGGGLPSGFSIDADRPAGAGHRPGPGLGHGRDPP